jgi:hypothetical protein
MGMLRESKKKMFNANQFILQPMLVQHLFDVDINVHRKTDALLSRQPFLYAMETFQSLGFRTAEVEMLTDAYDAITTADLWDFMRHPSTPGRDGFMFSSAIELAMINAEMKVGHSGASYAWVMRHMERIAKDGMTVWANGVRAKRALEQLHHEEEMAKIRADRACGCRREKGLTSGWCGVAGGGVPACDH